MEGHGLCAMLTLGFFVALLFALDAWHGERKRRKHCERVMAAAGRNLEEADQANFLFRAQYVAKRTRIYLETELEDA